jgi:presenilin-like A22 family membrane protease
MRDDLQQALSAIIGVLLGITLLILLEIKNTPHADLPWEEVICAFALGVVVGRNWRRP